MSGGGAGAGAGGEVDVPADMATMFIMDLMRQKKEKVMRMKKDEMINEMAMKQKAKMNQGESRRNTGEVFFFSPLVLLSLGNYRAQRFGVQIFGRDRLHGSPQHTEVLLGADAGRRHREKVSIQEEEAQVGGGGGGTETGVNRMEGKSDCI